MQFEIKMDSSYTEPKIIILTASVTEEISTLLQRLTESNTPIISGSRNGRIEILEQKDLLKIYSGTERYSRYPIRGNIFCGSGFTKRRRGWIRPNLSGSPIRKSLI